MYISEKTNSATNTNFSNSDLSIVMATYNPNCSLFKMAIQSVLCQTFGNFELIIVDDGSDTPIEPFVKSITNDRRVRIYRIKNSGLGAALNYGIEKSSSNYIARLDDDDLMLPERLEKQVRYLDNHPEVSCVGTWFYDKYGMKIFPHREYPTEHNEIVRSLLKFRFSLAHTTLMFRRSSFEQIGGYRIQGGGQDLDLELQLGTVGKLSNVPEILNCYTMSANGLGTVNSKKYEAYLFALEDVVKRKLYPEYMDIALSSIDGLRRIDNSPLKNYREKAIRYYLISRCKFFGKSLDMSFLEKMKR